MIHDPHHTLTSVTVEPPTTLWLGFADGAAYRLDLAPTVQSHPALAALADPAVFAKARLERARRVCDLAQRRTGDGRR